MSAVLLAQKPEASVYHAGWRDLLVVVPECALLYVDAPYSERTHSAHDAGAQTANKAAAWAGRVKDDVVVRPNQIRERRYAAKASAQRAKLSYDFWTPREVRDFVAAWSPRTTGWFVTLTDHVLAPHWEHALRKQGRLVFSPLACVEPGSRVRMVGDGPAQWSCLAIVARPREKAYSKWGALPGAYVVPPGYNARATNGGKDVTGGKPDWLNCRIIEDYSRPGDLVCDPTAGAFTAMESALKTGRRFVGGDIKREHAEFGCAILERGTQAPLFLESGAA